MRNLILTILFLFEAVVTVIAQPNDQRLLSVKIGDALAMLPAYDKKQLDKSMQAISELGEKGIVDMFSMLSASGSDNTVLEYAIDGYSDYVMQPGKEPLRQAAVRAYCTALDKVPGNTNKQFLIYQLQQIGKDDAVSCLQKYVTDATLSGPAARALAQINTLNTQKVLLTSLAHSSGATQLSYIEALGDVRYKAAVPALITLAKETSEAQRKTVLYALARIGDPSAASLLQSAAQKAGYSFDNTDATAAYLLYVQQLADNGNSSTADKLAKKLIQDAAASKQLHTRIAALKLSVNINGQKGLPLLYEAMKDNNLEYRAAALQFAVPYQTAATNQQWITLLNSVSPDAQAQIITFIGRSNDKSSLPALKKFLNSNNESVKVATIMALGRIGQQQSLPLLLNQMKKGNDKEIEAVKNTILLMKGDSVTWMVAQELPNMPSNGKVALLNILAARAADHAVNNVLNELKSSDTAVHKAAVQALPSVVSQQDLSKLFTLLASAKNEDVASLQQAIINASADIQDAGKRTALILQQMNKEPNEKQSLYFNVLATIGGNVALQAIQNAFNNGNEQTKAAAIAALSKGTGPQAARTLLQIASTSNNLLKEAAVNGYVDIIHKSSLPAEEKVLLLQEAMDAAQTDLQRQRILQEAGNNKTFLSLMLAGKYLDTPALQEQAANAVMNIALSNKDFNGDIVRNLLTKASPLLKGRDADYERQAIQKYLSEMPAGEGFVALFNGKDLTGWKGLVANPIERAKMSPETLAKEQEKADKIMREGWLVKDGLLVFSGKGENLCTQKQYGDFEMFVDWKITKDGDAGIYLRGTPQVQIWDTARRDAGAQVGSGGLYNNQKHESKPLVLADNAIGEWNTFHIVMRGDQVTVYLNGKLVTDNTVLENYWDRNLPIFPKEQIELQAHGTYVAYRNIYLKELTGSEPFALSDEEKKEGFKILFDGSNLDQWTGNKIDYKVDNNTILIEPKEGSHGNLYTKEEFGDFNFRFEFQLTPGANNGVGIRAPLEGDAAYVGMEIQILDNEAPIYKDLQPYQYHGSVYGVIPAKRGFLKPMGEWNSEEIIAQGSKIKVILNGEVILDGDIDEASKNGTMDHKDHPGLKRKTGHIGFLGHGSVVRFRNIRVKEL